MCRSRKNRSQASNGVYTAPAPTMTLSHRPRKSCCSKSRDSRAMNMVDTPTQPLVRAVQPLSGSEPKGYAKGFLQPIAQPPPAYEDVVGKTHDSLSHSSSLASSSSSSSSSLSSSSDSLPKLVVQPSPASSLPDISGDLAKLIAIPATAPKLGSPFLRAYPPVLGSHGISKIEFLSFLDHLNRVSVASPPVQLLSMAGGLVSIVPEPTAQIVGAAVQVGAGITTVAVSKGRTELLLRDVNKNKFGPRGLKASLAKFNAVATLGNMPFVLPGGRIDRSVPILPPFENSEEVATLSPQERRLRALEPWIEQLEIETESQPEKPNNLMGKMHARVSERQRGKQEARLMKSRLKAERKAERQYAKSAAKGREPRYQSATKNKEEKAVRSVYFLIITNTDGKILQ